MITINNERRLQPTNNRTVLIRTGRTRVKSSRVREDNSSYFFFLSVFLPTGYKNNNNNSHQRSLLFMIHNTDLSIYRSIDLLVIDLGWTPQLSFSPDPPFFASVVESSQSVNQYIYLTITGRRRTG